MKPQMSVDGSVRHCQPVNLMMMMAMIKRDVCWLPPSAINLHTATQRGRACCNPVDTQRTDYSSD